MRVFAARFLPTLGLMVCLSLPSPVYRVGDQATDGILVSTGQLVQGLGTRFTIPGRPVDLVGDGHGKLYVKATGAIFAVDAASGSVLSQAPLSSGASLHGLALSADGATLYATDAGSGLHVYSTMPALAEKRVISFPAAPLGGPPYPCGIALSPDGSKVYVCLSRSNKVQEVDAWTGKLLRAMPVAPCPYDAVFSGGRLVVTCWSREAVTPEPTAPSAGTQVPVDARGIAVAGKMVFIDCDRFTQQTRPTGLQPSQVIDVGGTAYSVEANQDTLSEWDPRGKPLRTLDLARAIGRTALAPNALAASPDGSRLYVACGGINAIAVVERGSTRLKYLGLISTDWYPTGAVFDQSGLIVCNAKGIGSRAKPTSSTNKSVYDFTGTLTAIKLPVENLAGQTALTLHRANPSENFLSNPAGPIPATHGLPGPIKHIFYILKENRTYDQILGDMPKGDGLASLAIYGQRVTPNHHAIADQFVLLDNYYCNGVLSADGHAWAVEGNATSYFEHAFGGWTRSYPYGDDPLSPTRTGFIWDDVLAHGKTFWNYGEFDTASTVPNLTWSQAFARFNSNTPVTIAHDIGVARVRRMSQPDYPGWDLAIPDVVRARSFIADFKARDSKKAVPDFSFIYLPQDHTAGGAGGYPPPASMIADNDLALGQIVDAISHSAVWRSSAIFVIEDDPQDGFDHVDGHRSLCLIASPYAKRRQVVSEFYNQTSVLRTMELILGLPAMNGTDGTAHVMGDCFTTVPDFTPYTFVQNQTPLGSIQVPTKKAALLMKLDRPDQLNERSLNRFLWAASRPGQPYPAQYEGPHGRGLAERGLELAVSPKKIRD